MRKGDGDQGFDPVRCEDRRRVARGRSPVVADYHCALYAERLDDREDVPASRSKRIVSIYWHIGWEIASLEDCDDAITQSGDSWHQGIEGAGGIREPVKQENQRTLTHLQITETKAVRRHEPNIR
jgi:hypothetical protein